MTISIRDAVISDVQPIHNLIEKTYRGESAKAGWTFESDLIDGARLQDGEILECLQDSNQKFFVAIDENQTICGVICVFRDKDWVEFGKFSVEPAMQGRGIGKLLIQKVGDFIKKEWGTSILKLMVLTKRKELVEFYERLGFVPTGEIKPFVEIHPYVILKNPSEELEIMVMEKVV